MNNEDHHFGDFQDTSHIFDEKKRCRDRLRSIRTQISTDEHVAWSRSACIHLHAFINKWITNHTTGVLVYCSKFPELDTSLLIDSLLTEHISIIVPIIQQSDVSLRLSYLTTTTSLVCSTFQVPEPIGCEIPARPEDVSVCIVPMLGFGKNGSRIGYGKGYYDRFLHRYSHIYKVGAAFSCQKCDEIPITADDIRMDLIITEHGIAYQSA